MPAMITTLHGELYAALNGHDWSSDFVDGVLVGESWDPELRHDQIDPVKAHVDVVPGDLTVSRVSAAQFLPGAVLSVAVRGRAATDIRRIALCDFAEAVVDFLSDRANVAFSWEIIEITTAPLVHLELLKTHKVWFSHLLVKFGYEVRA